MRRTGFALPAAIFALVLLSALVAGALFVSTEELRTGRTDLADQRALALAEAALERAIVTWDTQRNIELAVGASTVIEQQTLATNDRVDVTATRVQRLAVWITARASSGTGGRLAPARHTIAAALRLSEPAVPRLAALSAGGRVTVDNGTVDGRRAGSSTPSLACPDDTPADVAGILLPDTLLACGPICSGAAPAGVFGAPALAAGLSLTSDAALSERAQIVLPAGAFVSRPAVASGVCDVTDALNWGDPGGGRCGQRYVVIHITGDATLGTGSRGQGILVVDGTLRVEAGAQFDGVVVAGNDVEVVGPDARLTGVVVARDRDGATGSRVADGGAIRFSSCAVQRAQLGVARLVRTPERWWAELR
ncbi:MAG TPA: hypothetical protein VM076_22395 [Gemmatimonadaceae bacterium]|nr:hypothetical protein [Gemmatimonadaceae bacterium]